MPKCSGGGKDGKGGRDGRDGRDVSGAWAGAGATAAEVGGRWMPKCSGGGKDGSEPGNEEDGTDGASRAPGRVAGAAGAPVEATGVVLELPCNPFRSFGGWVGATAGVGSRTAGGRDRPPVAGMAQRGSVYWGSPHVGGASGVRSGEGPGQAKPGPNIPPFPAGIPPGRPPGTGQPIGVHPAPDRPGIKANHITTPPITPTKNRSVSHR
jgi:hypothetical protein